MLQIIGGEYRRRRLKTPADTEDTRPYSARARESVFNLLRGWFDGGRVLDLFAGVGTMGLEAVSRGAAEVVMVEQNHRILRFLNENIEMLGCRDRARAVQGDALSPQILSAAPRATEIVLIDPPYATMRDEKIRDQVTAQANRCRTIMADSGFLVLRTPIEPKEPDGWARLADFDGPEVHRTGRDMWVLLYAPARPPADSVD